LLILKENAEFKESRALQPFGPQQQSGVSFCAWPVLGQESCLEFDWIHSIENLPVIRFPYRKKKIHKDDIGKMQRLSQNTFYLNSIDSFFTV